MRLFRRRDREPEPDPAFPYLTLDAAARVRALVGQRLVEYGIEPQVYPDRMVAAELGEFGLTNLMARCAQRAPAEWTTVIAEHVDATMTAIHRPDPFDAPRAEVLARTFVRLAERTQFGDHALEYPTEVWPGVLRMYYLDQPNSVEAFTDGRVRECGAHALEQAGLANLRAVRFDEHEHLSDGGIDVHLLLGDSVFTASTAVIIAEIVARELGIEQPSNGVFLATPNRHQLVVHVPTDERAMPSLQAMARFAVAGYRDGVGPLSPDVVWWRDGRFDAISRFDGQAVEILVGPELAATLRRIGAGPG